MLLAEPTYNRTQPMYCVRLAGEEPEPECITHPITVLDSPRLAPGQEASSASRRRTWIAWLESAGALDLPLQHRRRLHRYAAGRESARRLHGRSRDPRGEAPGAREGDRV